MEGRQGRCQNIPSPQSLLSSTRAISGEASPAVWASWVHPWGGSTGLELATSLGGIFCGFPLRSHQLPAGSAGNTEKREMLLWAKLQVCLGPGKQTSYPGWGKVPCSAPGVTPVPVGRGCYFIQSFLLCSGGGGLMWCSMESSFPPLLCTCPTLISSLNSHSSLFLFPVQTWASLQALGACATPGRGVGDSRGSVAAGEGAPGAVMPLESWIPSL